MTSNDVYDSFLSLRHLPRAIFHKNFRNFTEFQFYNGIRSDSLYKLDSQNNPKMGNIDSTSNPFCACFFLVLTSFVGTALGFHIDFEDLTM